MCALPQDVVDMIINMTDMHTKTLLYDSKDLHTLILTIIAFERQLQK